MVKEHLNRDRSTVEYVWTSVYYRPISKLFIDILHCCIFYKELNYFICCFLCCFCFVCVLKSWIVLFVNEELILLCLKNNQWNRKFLLNIVLQPLRFLSILKVSSSIVNCITVTNNMRGISIQAKENWNYIKSKTKVKEGIGELHDIDPNNIKSAKTDHRALSLST